MQRRCFAQSAKMITSQNSYSCLYSELSSSPSFCIKNASYALKLGLSDREIEQSIKTNMARHSKVTDRAYKKQDAINTDKAVLSQYQESFSLALQWKSETLDLMPA